MPNIATLKGLRRSIDKSDIQEHRSRIAEHSQLQIDNVSDLFRLCGVRRNPFRVGHCWQRAPGVAADSNPRLCGRNRVAVLNPFR
jgi:hypothetical protein